MQYDQLQARAAALCSQEGWTEVSPAPDFASLVNRAWNHFAWDTELVISTENVTSVSNQVEYTLTGNYKRILDVTYNGTYGLLKSSEVFERGLSPSWRISSAGTPSRWVQMALNKVAIIPPTASNGVTIAVRGVSLGTALSAASDTPSVAPDLYHEAIALKAAILHGLVYAQGEGLQRLQVMEAQYQAYVAQAKTMLHNDDSPGAGGASSPVIG